MTSHATARSLRATEQQKARGRVVLLTLIGLVCPPLAGVRSVVVWIFYVLFFIVYSLWASRLVHSFSRDRRLGYLLSVTDATAILPLLVWAPAGAIRAVLIALCVVGLLFTIYADGIRSAVDAARSRQGASPDGAEPDSAPSQLETSLERALRVRLHVYEATQGRFALVVLRVLRFQEIADYYGPEAADRALAALGRRGLRQLGADGQHFFLPGGRVAFVFSTGSAGWRVDGDKDNTFELVDPYDVESFAMALGRKACEHLVDGHRIECVVGWASAPSDGLDPEDLLYAAESGAQSTAAFRRVAGTAMQAANTRRVAAG